MSSVFSLTGVGCWWVRAWGRNQTRARNCEGRHHIGISLLSSHPCVDAGQMNHRLAKSSIGGSGYKQFRLKYRFRLKEGCEEKNPKKFGLLPNRQICLERKIFYNSPLMKYSVICQLCPRDSSLVTSLFGQLGGNPSIRKHIDVFSNSLSTMHCLQIL